MNRNVVHTAHAVNAILNLLLIVRDERLIKDDNIIRTVKSQGNSASKGVQQKHLRTRVGLKLLHSGNAVFGGDPADNLEGLDASLVDLPLKEVNHRGELACDDDLSSVWPLLAVLVDPEFGEELEKPVQFVRGEFRLEHIDFVPVAVHLPFQFPETARELLEAGHLRQNAVGNEGAVLEGRQRLLDHLVVGSLLLWLHLQPMPHKPSLLALLFDLHAFRHESRVSLRRQVGRDLPLRPAKGERLDGSVELRLGAVQGGDLRSSEEVAFGGEPLVNPMPVCGVRLREEPVQRSPQVLQLPPKGGTGDSDSPSAFDGSQLAKTTAGLRLLMGSRLLRNQGSVRLIYDNRFPLADVLLLTRVVQKEQLRVGVFVASLVSLAVEFKGLMVLHLSHFDVAQDPSALALLGEEPQASQRRLALCSRPGHGNDLVVRRPPRDLGGPRHLNRCRRSQNEDVSGYASGDHRRDRREGLSGTRLIGKQR